MRNCLAQKTSSVTSAIMINTWRKKWNLRQQVIQIIQWLVTRMRMQPFLRWQRVPLEKSNPQSLVSDSLLLISLWISILQRLALQECWAQQVKKWSLTLTPLLRRTCCWMQPWVWRILIWWRPIRKVTIHILNTPLPRLSFKIFLFNNSNRTTSQCWMASCLSKKRKSFRIKRKRIPRPCISRTPCAFPTFP